MSKSLGTAVVTGASTGIGAVYADRLAKRGYDLVLVARDTARIEVLAQRLIGETGVSIETLTADLTDRAALARVEARVARDDVTLLVNNAGMTLDGSLLDNAVADTERLLSLNMVAPTVLAAAAGKGFVARKGGAIVNVASVLAYAPEQFNAVYAGTKSFLLTLSQGLAANAGDSGLYVQAVLPGATRTEIWQRSGLDLDGLPQEMVMDVDDLVDAALIGFDRRETVTIPPLADTADWVAMEARRLALYPQLSRREPAPRYRETVAA